MVYRISFILAFFYFGLSVIPAGASLSNVYIGQTAKGANTGVDCANAFGATFFNSAGNWGSGASQIGPGTTAHVCGVWTLPAGGQALQFQGSGIAGNVITLYFEPGAVIQAPYFAWSQYTKTGGAINLNGMNHLLLDGGTTCGVVNRVAILTGSCNGVIRTTDNGTNLTYHNATTGIQTQGGASTDIEIRNFVIHLYTRVDPHAEILPADGIATYGMYFTGSAWSNINVHHNNLQGHGRALLFDFSGVSTSNLQVHHNYVGDMGWGITVAGYGDGFRAANIQIYNNEITNWCNWVSPGDPSNGLHSNGIYTFDLCATDGCTTNGVGDASSNMYNNYIHGDMVCGYTGASASGFIQASTHSYFNVFNNLLVWEQGPSGYEAGEFFFYFQGCNAETNHLCSGSLNVFNNTLIGNANTELVYMALGPTVSTKNNLMTTGTALNYGSCGFHGFTADYNLGYNLHASHWISENCSGSTLTLAQWQGTPYLQDLHSTTGNPLLSGTYQLQVGSAAIGAGTNLTSLGIAALNVDANGVARPTTGPWDIGAFQFSSNNLTPPSAPFNLIIQ